VRRSCRGVAGGPSGESPRIWVAPTPSRSAAFDTASRPNPHENVGGCPADEDDPAWTSAIANRYRKQPRAGGRGPVQFLAREWKPALDVWVASIVRRGRSQGASTGGRIPCRLVARRATETTTQWRPSGARRGAVLHAGRCPLPRKQGLARSSRHNVRGLGRRMAPFACRSTQLFR
jgi:hypothetical protein